MFEDVGPHTAHNKEKMCQHKRKMLEEIILSFKGKSKKSV